MRSYRRSLELATALIDDIDGEDHRVAVAAHLNDCFRGTVTLFVDGSRHSGAGPSWRGDGLSRLSLRT